MCIYIFFYFLPFLCLQPLQTGDWSREIKKKKKRDFWRTWGAKKHGEKSLLKSWDGQTKGTSHSQNE